MKQYYVYIMTNKSRTLYTGMTNDLRRRVSQHKGRSLQGFTSEYNIVQLVYYEVTNDVRAAIAREKRIKGWLRAKKKALIDSFNPSWRDLSDEVPPRQAFQREDRDTGTRARPKVGDPSLRSG